MSSLAKYAHYLGCTGTLEALPGCSFAIKVLDVRVSFGRIDVQVTPVAGHGETWVEVSRVNFTVVGE
jgi:hypothetical protein